MAQLTAGAVNSMNNNITGIKPTLQLIDVKKIQPANPTPCLVRSLLRSAARSPSRLLEVSMSAARFLFAAACLATAADALVVGGRGVSSVRQAATPLAPFTIMKSQEDKEFEEWARKKKIAAGVDPDEDFAGGREVESNIYVVGGAVAPPRRPPAHLLPAPPTRTLLSCSSEAVRGLPLSSQASSRCSCPRSLASGPTTRATSPPSKPRPRAQCAVVMRRSS